MKLIYESSTVKNKSIKPVIILEYKKTDDFIAPERGVLFSQDYKEYTKLYLNFSYGLFECLNPTDIEKLNVLYELAEQKINYQIWPDFLLTSGIELPPIKKSFYNPIKFMKNNEYDKIEDLKKIHCYYTDDTYVTQDLTVPEISSDTDIIKMQTKAIRNLENIIVKLEEKNEEKKKYPKCITEIQCENTTELLFSFINCLVNDKIPYTIRKCNCCKSFFIANKSTSNKYCDRIDNSGLTCKQIMDKVRSRNFNENKDNIRILENRIRKLFSVPYVTQEKHEWFLEENKKNKGILQAEEYEKWLMSFYKKKKS